MKAFDISTNDLIGKPYKNNGIGPDEYDCYGLISECMRRAGYPPPPSLVIPYSHAGMGTLASREKVLWQKQNTGSFGCVILLTIKGYSCHCAFQLNNYYFIHAWESGGVSIERLPRWKRRIEGFYRYVPVDGL